MNSQNVHEFNDNTLGMGEGNILIFNLLNMTYKNKYITLNIKYIQNLNYIFIKD